MLACHALVLSAVLPIIFPHTDAIAVESSLIYDCVVGYVSELFHLFICYVL
jgi:hypothetical protein